MEEKNGRKKWKNSLNNLFDIAHANAVQMISIQEDGDFLSAQRETGLRGKWVIMTKY